MRTNNYGRGISLRDEVIDILNDGIQISDADHPEIEAAIQSFFDSKAFEELVDDLLMVMDDHYICAKEYFFKR